MERHKLVLRNKRQYQAALKRLEALMSLDPSVDSPRGKELVRIADHIEAYEAFHYPTPWHRKLKYFLRAKIAEWWFRIKMRL